MKNIIPKLNRIKAMPARMVIKIVVRKLNKEGYYIIRKLKLRYQSIEMTDCNFNYFISKCNFFYNIKKKEEYISRLKLISPVEEILNSAKYICMHKFNLLGSCDKYLGRKLPWTEDFESRFKWDNKFYKDIKLVDLSNDADVKVPWELSRFQHVFTLGKAYWITNDEKYALEFKEEIENWSESNPLEMSVNWTCTMDVAIRAVNWISGYFFFRSSTSIKDEFWGKFNELLYLHGRFIYRNLENEGQHNGNHYLSDLVGLIWLGIYFGDFSAEDNGNNNPKDWLKFGLAEFENEMKEQVNDDGTDYEASTAYHRLVTELFLFTTILCNKNNIYFSDKYMQKLEKMCEFIMNITKPNGLSPLIGDADDGRLIIPSQYYNWNRRDFRHILSIAGEYFERDDFKAAGKDYGEDSLWITGNFEIVNSEVHLESKAYASGGYYILRNNRIYCMIKCGELSCRGDGRHSHNDQLSIEVNIDGEDFIIDAGIFVYTADYKMRNLYRSTEMHNTLYIDGFEQNDFNEYDVFYMKEQTFANCTLFNDRTFYGEHYGYKDKCGIIHKRKISLSDYTLTIEDELIGKKVDNNVYINFILDNGVEIVEKDNGIELIKNGKKVFLHNDNAHSVKDAFVSYGYGQKLNTKRLLIIMKNTSNKIEIICD